MPGLSRWFQATKSEAVRKRTDWSTPGRTPDDLGVLNQPRELCKRLDVTVLTTVFPSAPESVTRACPSPRTLPLRRMRMGVPGPITFKKATYAPSHYQSEGDTGYVAFRPVGGSGDSSSGNLPETGETLHGEGGEHAYHARKLVKHSNHPQTPKNMDSTLGGKPHSHEHGHSHSQPPNHKENTLCKGRGACLGREDQESLPPREERTRWGLLVG
ncbi:hypothetical protein Taro_010829 [Colocasia esculenta]|uniref:Uncharacterized protein n=1 Tax=Colocasia esculenta TaxID=4460 RepID=A0A843UEB1_COLES|nr:hypothetical protein [Colocasia esculenta]